MNAQKYMQAIAAIIGDIGYGSLPSFLVSRDIYDSTRFAVVVSPADLGLGKAYLEDENIADLGAALRVGALRRRSAGAAGAVRGLGIW